VNGCSKGRERKKEGRDRYRKESSARLFSHLPCWRVRVYHIYIIIRLRSTKVFFLLFSLSTRTSTHIYIYVYNIYTAYIRFPVRAHNYIMLLPYSTVSAKTVPPIQSYWITAALFVQYTCWWWNCITHMIFAGTCILHPCLNYVATTLSVRGVLTWTLALDLDALRHYSCCCYLESRNSPLWNVIFGWCAPLNARDGSLSHRVITIPCTECYRFQISLFRLNRTEMINGRVYGCVHCRVCVYTRGARPPLE